MKLHAPTLEAALQAALRLQTDKSFATLLRFMPAKLIQSEASRRRSLMRTADQRRGPTGNWAHHNPAVKNCRCITCHTMRQAAD